MPRHSYICYDCGHQEDRIYSIKRSPPKSVECPKCAKRAYREWLPPRGVHVAATEFVGKYGTYDAKNYDMLSESFPVGVSPWENKVQKDVHPFRAERKPLRRDEV